MKNIGVPEVTHENINEASLRLSEKLYKEHQKESAANLSWVISALLL